MTWRTRSSSAASTKACSSLRPWVPGGRTVKIAPPLSTTAEALQGSLDVLTESVDEAVKASS